MTAVVMADCTGLWRRSLLINADGTRDAGNDVLWLQGLTAYVDSRGFAGRLRQRGGTFEWGRMVDLQPPSEFPDVGHMRWNGSTLVETGVHVDYVEHWEREDVARFPCWGVAARGAAGDDALLLRVGGQFGWASAYGVLIGALEGGDWSGLDVRLDGDDLRAGGGQWKVIRTEGVVML